MEQQLPTDEQPQQLPSAPFPAPPPFWKRFTAANQTRLKELESSSTDPAKPDPLPLELTYLRPPPPPSSDLTSYSTFSIAQSLTGLAQAPPADILLFDPTSPSLNHASLLSRLTKSLLLNFLELATILGNDPDAGWEGKTADIRRLMVNVHSVINMYRPHQAREGVREMLEEILEKGEEEVRQADEVGARVRRFLAEVAEGQASAGDLVSINTTPGGGIRAKDETVIEESRRMWRMIHDMQDD